MSEQAFSSLDIHFAGFLAGRSGLSGTAKNQFQELVGRVSAALEAGHSCLPLTDSEIRILAGNPLVSDGGRTPLVLHNGRLYLHRYYRYETRLAAQIRAMAAITFAPGNEEALFDPYFAGGGSAATDWQKEAAKIALKRALAIICGGPGTGKTTTVVKILAILMQAMESERLPEIALAAPTGKAAMRLSESVGNSMKKLELPKNIENALPVTVHTLHRLLGVRRNSPQFRHNRENPMAWDVVVVDEASMVDLAMMSKLVDALKPGARLLLLGDKDQLASVESGTVLGDFIVSLPDNTVELQTTYRFDDNIKQLAKAINAADSDTAWELLVAPAKTNITLLGADPIPSITERYARFMTAVYRPGSPDLHEIFQLFNSFRVLCGVHYGNRGVDGINRRLELSLAGRGFPCRSGTWYPGRPVLITRNDYGLDLYNGDIGICLPDREKGDLKVWFERADGHLRSYSSHRLPQCETVFAMTIHKSQGSEFDEVVVVLPEEDNRILSRELIYTAVTRARKSVRLVAEKQILRLALSRSIERFSGLADLLAE
ncbi:MAG: hypothetical protein VR65_16420 [Desulfobulbaceae bacterium BRH_c16a]|nr:MAG: hypothetical protein VR65_16420 [Desulfobulbaceae bacterium BRH_c16a]